MKILFPLILIFIGISGLSQNDLDKVLKRYNRGHIPYISVTEARMLQLQEKIILLDAREKEEYEVSHLPSALFIGYKEFSGKDVSDLVSDKNQSIVVYCSIGIRSEKIAEKLKKMGYQNVHNLYGGIFEWSNKELPLEDHLGFSTLRVHIYSKEWAPYLKKGSKVN
jgi:rhodanese-related sulfurtransferase